VVKSIHIFQNCPLQPPDLDVYILLPELSISAHTTHRKTYITAYKANQP